MKGLEFLESFCKDYDNIVIVANSGSLDGKTWSDRIFAGNTLLVVFNTFRLSKVPLNIDILWVHRLSEPTGDFFGAASIKDYESRTNLFHLCVVNSQIFDNPEWAMGSLSSLYNLPNIENYPVGSRLFCIKEKYIISPTTGFVIISILNEFVKTNKIKASLTAIGFGRLTDGSQKHHWQYERKKYLSFKTTRFVNHKLKREPARMLLRAIIPNWVLRIFFDLRDSCCTFREL